MKPPPLASHVARHDIPPYPLTPTYNFKPAGDGSVTTSVFTMSSVLLQVLTASFVYGIAMSIPTGPCSCGVFLRQNAFDETELLQSHEVFQTSCSESDNTKCQEMCVALATVSSYKAPVILCAMLKKDIAPFKPAVFWRNCNSKWTFSGLAATEEISCSKGKPTPIQL